MKLEFWINEDYLIAHTIVRGNKGRFSSDTYRAGPTDFLRKARYSPAYLQIIGIYPEKAVSDPLETLLNEERGQIEALKDTTEYRRLLEQTEAYRQWLESEWKASYCRTLGMMQDITGVDLRSGQIAVYVTHPALTNGSFANSGEEKRIHWGHSEDFPNYSIVYLWHETMHDVMPPPYPEDIGHSVINLATDNELRVRLNGGSYPPLVGHDRLIPTMKQMLPEWMAYLRSDEENILEFTKRMEGQCASNNA